MRILPACFAGALLAIPAVLLGYATPPPGKSGPPVVPYLCEGGHEATAIYESGSDFQHATANRFVRCSRRRAMCMGRASSEFY